MLPKEKNMTAKRYKIVLQRYIVPSYNRIRAKHGNDVVFMEDNAKWHKAKIVQAYLRNKSIKLIPHPAQSPNLTPIENV
jgi:transposase